MAESDAIDITANEVRQRLALTSLDIDDDIINSASMITVADAWANQVLSEKNTDLDSITDDQAAMLKAAKIAFVCKRLVTSANVEEFDVGPIKGKNIKASEKSELRKELDIEIKELLDMADLLISGFSFSYSGGGDYHPSGEDYTNIDFSQASEDSDDPFRVFP